MAVPGLRIIVDGDSNVYRKGDKVSGRVALAVDEEVSIESVMIIFTGTCTTKTTRPLHVNGNANNPSSRREYEQRIPLFSQEKVLAPTATLASNKYSWDFSFTFPEQTEPHFSRLSHGSKYPREPHTLPPTFQLRTNAPSGAAQISYFLQARLALSGSRDVKRCKQLLRYHPTAPTNTPREAKVTSTVLYGQILKPHRSRENSSRDVSKVLSRQSSSGKRPQIVPCLLYPETIAPGQHIPLSLTLRNKRDPLNKEERACILDSLSVTISTFSTVMCGNTLTQPEDVVSKHVTCIAKSNMNTTLPFAQTKALTSNFRLIDDAECVPTFTTYTITRRYALDISIGIKFGEQTFTIRSSTPLTILPRRPRSLNPPPRVDEYDLVEPLPVYEPREPSREFAPDYESIYALSRTTTSTSSSSTTSLSLVASRSSSLYSGPSVASTAASTPASEVGQPELERSMMRAV